MTSTLATVLLGVVGMLYVTFKGLVDEELRARLDDFPALLVSVVLRVVPADQRDDYRADWEGALLVSFHEANARYPLTRPLKAIVLVGPLFWHAGRLRADSWAARRAERRSVQRQRIGLFKTVRVDLEDVRVVYYGDADQILSGSSLMQPGVGEVLTKRRLRKSFRAEGIDVQRLNRRNRWVRM